MYPGCAGDTRDMGSKPLFDDGSAPQEKRERSRDRLVTFDEPIKKEEDNNINEAVITDSAL